MVAYQILIGTCTADTHQRDTTQLTVVAASVQDARDEVLCYPDADRDAWRIIEVREVELFPIGAAA